jgi:hypothetical protein
LVDGFTIDVTNNEKLPTAILIFFLCASSIYAYFFLLIPVTRQTKTIFNRSRYDEWLFHGLFVISAVFAGGFILYHTYTLTLTDDILKSLSATGRPSAGQVADGLYFVKSWHLVILVMLNTALDASVILSSDPLVKSKFITLVSVIDFPIVISVLFIWLVLKDPLGEHFPYVEAAVLSFLMLAGSLASIVLEALDIRIRSNSHESSGHAPKA